MKIQRIRESFCGRVSLVLTILTLIAVPNFAAQSAGQSQDTLDVPHGTVLPVRLNQTFSSKNAKPGQSITARIMQDVPLPNGQRIPAGSKLTGKITSVDPAKSGTNGRVALCFDNLLVGHHSIPILTSLRALAGFMAVLEAETPEFTTGFGTPRPWANTQQIGGDQVYGVGGPVTNRWSERVGTAVYDGVLVHVRASSDSKCRGAWDSEDRPQALWVFSADACGVYGLQHVQIAHGGRSDPVGTIILVSDTRDLKLRASDALLLRVR